MKWLNRQFTSANSRSDKLDFPIYKTGDLVEVIEAGDQGVLEKSLVGKFGLVVENIESPISPNLWKILLDDKFYVLHAYDIRIIE